MQWVKVMIEATFFFPFSFFLSPPPPPFLTAQENYSFSSETSKPEYQKGVDIPFFFFFPPLYFFPPLFFFLFSAL